MKLEGTGLARYDRTAIFILGELDQNLISEDDGLVNLMIPVYKLSKKGNGTSVHQLKD